MSDAVKDPRCPECGEPIGQTATYCMHCSADLSAERAAADADGDGAWDRAEASSPGPQEHPSVSHERASGAGGVRSALESVRGLLEKRGNPSSADGEVAEHLLRPDGLVDNTLTILVGIVGGIIVGIVGIFVLGVATGSGWAVGFGILAWLVSTAYLVRRRTVQSAVAKSGYAVAVVLLTAPLIALSPVVSVDGGIEERGGLFFLLFVFAVIPAGIAAAIGWVASQFVSEETGVEDG